MNGKSSEDEVEVVCEGAVSVGSISMRNMASERGDESFRETHKESLQCAL